MRAVAGNMRSDQLKLAGRRTASPTHGCRCWLAPARRSLSQRPDGGARWLSARDASVYRSASDIPNAGDEWAVRRLAELLAERGDLDGAEQILRARADAGDESAASRLAELLAQRGDLAELLEERGDLDGALQILRAWANVGDWDAAPEAARPLLARIIAGPVISVDELTGAHVLPVPGVPVTMDPSAPLKRPVS